MTHEAPVETPPQTGDFEVLIIGAGPVGLSSALQLGRLGVNTLLVERRGGLSRHPKAGGIHARTMEIFRRWDISDEIRSVGRGDLPPGVGPSGFAWVTRLSGIELGRIEFGLSPEDQKKWASYSPEPPGFCGQDLYEPILFREVSRYPSVRVELARRASVVGQDDEGVSIVIEDEASGRSELVRARYVIACDGVRSPTRGALGIGESGYGAFGDSISVQFRADLEKHRRGRNFGLFWVANPDTQGAFTWRRRSDSWLYNFDPKPGEDAESYTADRCRDIIRKAVGDSDVGIEIESILPWKHDQAVSDAWRAGRVFLAGDAAHRFPPHGGFGMNSGVQDSVNLVWKLVLVLRGQAGDALLDTYEAERKPVAEFNGRQCLENTHRMEETGWLLRDPGSLADIEKPGLEGQAARDRVAAAIPRQREQFYSHGQQFGSIYESAAVIPDGTEPERSTISDYYMTAHPGARAPHLWLTSPGGGELSTLDLFGDGFVVLAGREGRAWRDAARSIGEGGAIPLTGYTVGLGGDFIERSEEKTLIALYGLAPDGAVLVRPDGHVAFRSKTSVADAARALQDALEALLGVRASGHGRLAHAG
ncbi:FAD-dependent monooxygenase [Methylocapsa aurea]|uniref:FAD-dependent monooxygenase n=1 Tax=Methylocapsa aurea TaxID=663610 RepID=UPI000A067B23|nr:FAD-dependent monooxygenase [Methylocapsa aurea]